MMRGLLVFLASMVCMAETASAGTVLTKLPATLDPAKAYVLVELGKLDDAMLDATLILSRYDPAAKDVAQVVDPSGKNAGARADRVVLSKALSKAGKRRLYALELQPGAWIIEGANDTAFSLGAPVLQLEPGSVTDLGYANVYSDFADGAKRDVQTVGQLLRSSFLGGGLFTKAKPEPTPKAVEFQPRGSTELALPAVFAGTARAPRWGASVRFPNNLGGLVNRMGGRKTRGQDAAPSSDPAPAPTQTAAPVSP